MIAQIAVLVDETDHLSRANNCKRDIQDSTNYTGTYQSGTKPTQFRPVKAAHSLTNGLRVLLL
jgi:hypothetical protein